MLLIYLYGNCKAWQFCICQLRWWPRSSEADVAVVDLNEPFNMIFLSCTAPLSFNQHIISRVLNEELFELVVGLLCYLPHPGSGDALLDR